MTPKKDEYMRGFGDGFKDGMAEMLPAIQSAEIAAMELCVGQDPANQCWVTLDEIREAISKAKGAA